MSTTRPQRSSAAPSMHSVTRLVAWSGRTVPDHFPFVLSLSKRPGRTGNGRTSVRPERSVAKSKGLRMGVRPVVPGVDVHHEAATQLGGAFHALRHQARGLVRTNGAGPFSVRPEPVEASGTNGNGRTSVRPERSVAKSKGLRMGIRPVVPGVDVHHEAATQLGGAFHALRHQARGLVRTNGAGPFSVRPEPVEASGTNRKWPHLRSP